MSDPTSAGGPLHLEEAMMHPGPDRSKAAVAIILTAAALLVGCTTGASLAPSPSTVPSAADTASSAAVSAAPSAEVFPAELVGTWVGTEHDFDSGETWTTTYRIEPCRQNLEPWWPPEDDQQCGDWRSTATIEGRPADCEASLSWLAPEGDAYVLMGRGPATSAKYETVPHPYLNFDGRWVCWDSFRIMLTPDASGAFAVETIGAGSRSGAFVATAGTVVRSDP